jgi:hypothetical protein
MTQTEDFMAAVNGILDTYYLDKNLKFAKKEASQKVTDSVSPSISSNELDLTFKKARSSSPVSQIGYKNINTLKRYSISGLHVVPKNGKFIKEARSNSAEEKGNEELKILKMKYFSTEHNTKE